MPRSVTDFALIGLAAALLVLPFHFGGLWFLSYAAFLPYFYALSGKIPRDALKVSFGLGVLFHLLLGYWLVLVSTAAFIALVFYFSLYFAAFGYFTAFFLNSEKKAALFYIPAFWVVLEFLRGWVLGGLPWALLGYSQWKNILWIQIADVTGVYGVSFFILLVNVALFKALERLRKGLHTAIPTILFSSVAVVSAYGAFSLWRADAFYKRDGGEAAFRVSVVQGNIPQDQKWNARIKNIIFEKYKRLTLMSAVEGAGLIVWPETSFPGFLEDEPVLAAQLRGLVRQSRTNVLVGAPTIGGMERGLRFFNSAILYGADGEEKKRYHKVHLVPFGEYVPMEFMLGFLRNFVEIGRFTAGREKTIFSVNPRSPPKSPPVRFAALVCFEDIFPELVRDFRRHGADFLVNITNDAWFGRTTAPYQHAQASVLRAVEHRVPVVRAANTGFSCFISPEGRVVDWVEDNGSPIFVTGHKSYDLVLRRTTSFYTRFGNVFLVLAAFLCYLAYRERRKQADYSRI